MILCVGSGRACASSSAGSCAHRLPATRTADSVVKNSRLLRIASDYRVPAVAIAFNLTLAKCLEQNLTRAGRVVDQKVLSYHALLLERAVSRLDREGYAQVYLLDETNVDDVVIERTEWKIEPAQF